MIMVQYVGLKMPPELSISIEMQMGACNFVKSPQQCCLLLQMVQRNRGAKQKLMGKEFTPFCTEGKLTTTF